MFQQILNSVMNLYRRRTVTPLDRLERLYKPYYPRILQVAQSHDAPNQPPHLKYGEIYTESFSDLLQMLNPTKGERFCDLGSGSGKAVLTALITTAITEAYGYEWNSDLIEISKAVTKRCPLVFKEFTNKKAEFICQDFTLLESLKDFQIIYVTATCFWGDAWTRLCALLETLPTNARVCITSRELESNSFEKIDETDLSMSWGVATVYLYKKMERESITQ